MHGRGTIATPFTGRIPRHRHIARASSGEAAKPTVGQVIMISSPVGAADETFLSPRRGLTLVIIAYTVGYARAYGTRSPTASAPTVLACT